MNAQINWEAYQEGFEAWELFHDSNLANRDMNPYVLDEIKWQSWNRGWNANQKGVESSKHRQYSAYLSNGGTMAMEEWERDGRWDKSYTG